LRDIIEIYPLINLAIIPRYQYTTRDVVTGTTFIAYAEELSVINSMRLIFLLLTWLQMHGIPLEEVEKTTDSGSEFIGSIYKKKDSGFTLVVANFGSRHRTKPVRRPEWNGCVENFHGRIEAEFYEEESFRDREDFLGKPFTFTHYFKIERSNIETGSTPREEVFTKTHIRDNRFFCFPSIVLDDLELLSEDLLSRYDVPEHHISFFPFPSPLRLYSKNNPKYPP